VLLERTAEPLRDTAGDLTFDEGGIDHPPAVVDGHVAQDPHPSGLDVDFDDGEVGTVGEGPRGRIRVVHGRFEARLDAPELVRSKVRGARDLAVAQAAPRAPADHGATAAELDVGGIRLQERRGH
jgi:hypothetical protein